MQFEQAFQISAPVETVWPVLSDLARYPEWAPTFDRMEFPHGGVLAKGLEVRFRVRGAPVVTWRVTEYETCRSFAWESTVRGVHTRANHVIEPSGDGTKLTLSVEMTGVMATLFAPMIRRVSVRNLALEGNALKARAEGMAGA